MLWLLYSIHFPYWLIMKLIVGLYFWVTWELFSWNNFWAFPPPRPEPLQSKSRLDLRYLQSEIRKLDCNTFVHAAQGYISSLQPSTLRQRQVPGEAEWKWHFYGNKKQIKYQCYLWLRLKRILNNSVDFVTSRNLNISLDRPWVK